MSDKCFICDGKEYYKDVFGIWHMCQRCFAAGTHIPQLGGGYVRVYPEWEGDIDVTGGKP